MSSLALTLSLITQIRPAADETTQQIKKDIQSLNSVSLDVESAQGSSVEQLGKAKDALTAKVGELQAIVSRLPNTDPSKGELTASLGAIGARVSKLNSQGGTGFSAAAKPGDKPVLAPTSDTTPLSGAGYKPAAAGKLTPKLPVESVPAFGALLDGKAVLKGVKNTDHTDYSSGGKKDGDALLVGAIQNGAKAAKLDNLAAPFTTATDGKAGNQFTNWVSQVQTELKTSLKDPKATVGAEGVADKDFGTALRTYQSKVSSGEIQQSPKLEAFIKGASEKVTLEDGDVTGQTTIGTNTAGLNKNFGTGVVPPAGAGAPPAVVPVAPPANGGGVVAPVASPTLAALPGDPTTWAAQFKPADSKVASDPTTKTLLEALGSKATLQGQLNDVTKQRIISKLNASKAGDGAAQKLLEVTSHPAFGSADVHNQQVAVETAVAPELSKLSSPEVKDNLFKAMLTSKPQTADQLAELAKLPAFGAASAIKSPQFLVPGIEGYTPTLLQNKFIEGVSSDLISELKSKKPSNVSLPSNAGSVAVLALPSGGGTFGTGVSSQGRTGIDPTNQALVLAQLLGTKPEYATQLQQTLSLDGMKTAHPAIQTAMLKGAGHGTFDLNNANLTVDVSTKVGLAKINNDDPENGVLTSALYRSSDAGTQAQVASMALKATTLDQVAAAKQVLTTMNTSHYKSLKPEGKMAADQALLATKTPAEAATVATGIFLGEITVNGSKVKLS